MESGPWGSKINRLADIAASRKLELESVDYTDCKDPDFRVERLRSVLDEQSGDCLLAGSSMGGYVSLLAAQTHPVKGLFLMAPAVHMPGYSSQADSTQSPVVDIVHGWNDEVIPAEHAIRFAREWGHALHLVNGNHALSDVLEDVDRLFSLFLDRVLGQTKQRCV